MQPEEGIGQQQRDAYEMEHSEDNEAFSDEEVGDQCYARSQAEYPEPPLHKPEAKSIYLPQKPCPGVAECEGDSDQQEEERGREASQIEPESRGYFDLLDAKIIEIIGQMEENHQDDGHSSQEVHLPESDQLPIFHKHALPPMPYRYSHFLR